MKDDIYREVNEILNEVLKTKKTYDLSMPILGEACIVDSITIVNFISLCNKKYNIDILENDINLECLDSLEGFVSHICHLLNSLHVS